MIQLTLCFTRAQMPLHGVDTKQVLLRYGVLLCTKYLIIANIEFESP